MENSLHINLDEIVKPDIEVTFKGKRYTLRPATEAVIIRWRGMQFRNTRMVGGKITADMTQAVESQSYLVHGCLYDGDKMVSQDIIKLWPSSAVSKLFDMAREISGITKEDEQRKEKESRENDTEESLTGEINNLTKRRDALLNGEEYDEEKDNQKNEQDSMTDT